MDHQRTAERLMFLPTTSTEHMWHGERAEGIEQMLIDLETLARRDGCIAAAWALEFITEYAASHVTPEHP